MSDLYGGKERRLAPRAPICMAVVAECDAWLEACVTKDLSESGGYLISQKLPSVASGFSVEVDLPGKLGMLRLHAAVARVQGAGPRGFGLEWKDLSDKNREVLRLVWERWSRAFEEE
jgi:hypothetical protein